MAEFDKNLYDEKTNRELKNLGDFLDGKKVEIPKQPQRPEKSDSKADKVYRELRKPVDKAVVDLEKGRINLED